MAFYILPHPANPIQGRYADHGDIRLYLGLARDAKLPLEFCTDSDIWVPLAGHSAASARLYCKPGNPSSNGWRGKSSAHRCFAVCPDCGEHVPAGRTHQHKCK